MGSLVQSSRSESAVAQSVRVDYRRPRCLVVQDVAPDSPDDGPVRMGAGHLLRRPQGPEAPDGARLDQWAGHPTGPTQRRKAFLLQRLDTRATELRAERRVR